LTETNHGYCEQCVSILAQFQAAECDARRMPAPGVSGYLESYPDIHVELTLNDRLVDLADEAFEAAIRVGALPHSNLIARPLAPLPRAVCVAPAYLA
jgi:DNA-binding transcriptional LysR family regulator